MDNFNLKKYLSEGKLLKEYASPELIDHIEGLSNIQDLKTLHDMLRILSTDWMQEGFEKEDIIDYLASYISTI